MSQQSLGQEVARRLVARASWHPLEVLFWAAALASIYVLPGRHLILTEIAILGLFALSLDLILGYAGIISLGQAAFFGFGAYTAGLLAKHDLVSEPMLALIVSGVAAARIGLPLIDRSDSPKGECTMRRANRKRTISTPNA